MAGTRACGSSWMTRRTSPVLASMTRPRLDRPNMTLFDPVATYALSNPTGRAVVDLESGRRFTYAELNAAVWQRSACVGGEFGPNMEGRGAAQCRKCASRQSLQLQGT